MGHKKSDEFALLLYLKILMTKREYNITLSDACKRHNFKPTSFPSLKNRALNIIKKYSEVKTMNEILSKCKRFKIGGTIVLEDLHIRHIRESSKSRGRGGNVKVSEKMYHSGVFEPIFGKYITRDCDNMDNSGFCLGHPMSREEFLQKYCDGIEPLSIE